MYVSSLGNNYCYILKGFAITSLIHPGSNYFVESRFAKIESKNYGVSRRGG